MTLPLTCEWCEQHEEYDSPRLATEAGWFVYWLGDKGIVFCSTECWLAWL